MLMILIIKLFLFQVRGRLAEAEAKKKAEQEKKEVPEEIKAKFETWNRYVVGQFNVGFSFRHLFGELLFSLFNLGTLLHFSTNIQVMTHSHGLKDPSNFDI